MPALRGRVVQARLVGRGGAGRSPVDDPAMDGRWPGPPTRRPAVGLRPRARRGSKSSFGDVVVEAIVVAGRRTVICDALIAPGFEPGAAAVLAAKRDGRFLVLEADPGQVPNMKAAILGVTIEQQRDAVPVATVLPADGALDAGTRADALLGLVTLRYTQSNSVALVRGGAAVGIGAGQQNRVDCVRLAGAKARTWWLRRHPFVDELPDVDGMGRQDRLNWQISFAGREMTVPGS